MSVSEVKLVVSIEDPRSREKRNMDMEVSVCELECKASLFVPSLLW